MLQRPESKGVLNVYVALCCFCISRLLYLPPYLHWIGTHSGPLNAAYYQ